MDDYEPTPMLSPWNGGGGFRTLKHEKGEQAVARIESSDDPRLASFRNAIAAARRVWDWGLRDGWWEEKPGGGKKYTLKPDKATFLAACRAVFPDEALDWLDASVVLTDARKPQYPLLLGTGGNLGRLDLTTTYMEALDVLLDPEQTSRTEELLAHALFGDGHPELDTKKVGQYFPAAAGTINSSAFDNSASCDQPMEHRLLHGRRHPLRFRSSPQIQRLARAGRYTVHGVRSSGRLFRS